MALRTAASLIVVAIVGLAILTPAAAGRGELKAAKSWAYQLNGDTSRLTSSAADVVVIDADQGRNHGLLARLKQKPGGGRRQVVGYLSIGEAERDRAYWSACCASGSPSWLTSKTQGWAGNFVVRYWAEAWKAFVEKRLDAMIAAGFDGVYFDRVDSWELMKGQNSNARGAMISLVKALSARARGQRSDFAIMVQNGEELLSDASYVSAIDAVAKESLFYGVAGIGQRNSSGDITYGIRDLKRAQSAGKTIFVVEYLHGSETERARVDIRAQGFVPFFAGRHLSGE